MWDILGNTFPINSNNKNMQALPGENQVVWKYQEKAQKVGQYRRHTATGACDKTEAKTALHIPCECEDSAQL
jgi:hypothetical protein